MDCCLWSSQKGFAVFLASTTGISILPATDNKLPIPPNTNSPSEWIDSNTCEAFLAPWRRVPHWNPETCAEAGVAVDAMAVVSFVGQWRTKKHAQFFEEEAVESFVAAVVEVEEPAFQQCGCGWLPEIVFGVHWECFHFECWRFLVAEMI